MINHAAVVDWLLEDNNPAIKFRTMTEILNKPFNDNEAHDTYKLIWQQKDIQKMLSKQNENGIWESSDYGVHTSMRYLTALAENGLRNDKRIDNFIDFTVDFLNKKENSTGTQGYDGCSNALVLRAIIMLGYHERSDVQLLINNYIASQLYDGGFMCKRLLDKKPGRKSCYKASVAGLLLYASCKQKGIVFKNTGNLTEYFLKRDVFYTSDKSNLLADGKEGWRYIDNFFPVESMRIGLPLIVSSLSILGAGKAKGTERAWDLLMSKKSNEGKLILDGTLSKQPFSFGKVGQANKWLTFYMLLSEKYNEEQDIPPLLQVAGTDLIFER